MKKKLLQYGAIGIGLVLVALALAANQGVMQAVWGSVSWQNVCQIDAAKSFSGTPELLVFLQAGTTSSVNDQVSVFESKYWTAPTLKRAIYDYMSRNFGQQIPYADSPVSIVSGSVAAGLDGIYWTNQWGPAGWLKVFTPSQQIKTITVWQHPEKFDISLFNSNDGINYNRGILSGFYGTDVDTLRCEAGYGVIPTTTTTLGGGGGGDDTTTTTIPDIPEPTNILIPIIAAIVGLLGLLYWLIYVKR